MQTLPPEPEDAPSFTAHIDAANETLEDLYTIADILAPDMPLEADDKDRLSGLLKRHIACLQAHIKTLHQAHEGHQPSAPPVSPRSD